MGTKMAPEIGAIKNLPAEKKYGQRLWCKRQELEWPRMWRITKVS